MSPGWGDTIIAWMIIESYIETRRRRYDGAWMADTIIAGRYDYRKMIAEKLSPEGGDMMRPE